MNEDLLYYTKEKLSECLKRAENHFNRNFPFPSISLDIRGRTAGQALYIENHIRLNPTAFRRHENEFINSTIPHELAHLISYQVYGIKGLGHKDCWKRVCRILGMTNITRCHSYNVQPAWRRKKLKRYAFACNCGTPHNLTSTRVKRIKFGAIYRCKFCKSNLRPI